LPRDFFGLNNGVLTIRVVFPHPLS